jgi:hypothetical protein
LTCAKAVFPPVCSQSSTNSLQLIKVLADLAAKSLPSFVQCAQ